MSVLHVFTYMYLRTCTLMCVYTYVFISICMCLRTYILGIHLYISEHYLMFPEVMEGRRLGPPPSWIPLNSNSMVRDPSQSLPIPDAISLILLYMCPLYILIRLYLCPQTTMCPHVTEISVVFRHLTRVEDSPTFNTLTHVGDRSHPVSFRCVCRSRIHQVSRVDKNP